MSAETINCRVHESKDCYHGRLSEDVYEEGGMAEDGTYDGNSVVCDACYIEIGMPTSSDPGSIAGGRSAHERSGDV